jgi:hypothetical protein
MQAAEVLDLDRRELRSQVRDDHFVIEDKIEGCIGAP